MSAKHLAPLFLIISTCAFDVEGNKLLEILRGSDKSGPCFSEIRELIKIERFNDMLNTWSNFSKEYLYGNSYDFGDFSSCMAFEHPKIDPQHCFIQYQYNPLSNRRVIPVLPKISMGNFDLKNNDISFGGAICIPISCTNEDISKLMNYVFEGSDFIQTTDYDQSKYCQHNRNQFELDALRITSIICLSLITTLTVLASFAKSSTSSSIFIKFLKCFSISRNFKTLKDFSTTNSTITCINGIKAISTIGIFFFHSFLIKITYPYSDGKVFQDVLKDDKNITIATFTIVIDTFLIVSGILVGRTLIKSENFNFWKFCIQRYMRLTLLTLVLICYNAVNYTLFKLYPKPYVHLDFTVIDDCKQYWWTTALNIQTFVNPKHMCLVHSWFASVLFHLIVFATLLHIMMKNMSRTKVFLYYAMILVYALFLRLLVFIPRETYFEADLASVMDMSNDILESTYYTIYTRVLPFFSGILLAHVLDQNINFTLIKNEKIKNFIIGIIFYFSITFILIFPFIRSKEKNLEIFYGILWIVATNIVIYACHKGHGGLINDFLSLKIWIPLSKMALSIYLVSLCHQGATTLIRLHPFTTLTMSDIIFGFIFDAIFLALPTLLIYTSVECSITNLANLITGKESKSAQKS